MKIADLITEDKQATFVYNDTDFKVRLRLLDTKRVNKISKVATTKQYNREVKAYLDEIDPEKYNNAVAAEAIVDWEGLTLDTLATIVPIAEEDMENAAETELVFSVENAQELVNHSPEFGAWLVERVVSLDSFRSLSE